MSFGIFSNASASPVRKRLADLIAPVAMPVRERVIFVPSAPTPRAPGRSNKILPTLEEQVAILKNRQAPKLPTLEQHIATLKASGRTPAKRLPTLDEHMALLRSGKIKPKAPSRRR